jgi:hypothetical protein
MMVNESTPNRPTLSAESLEALESAMRVYLTTGTSPATLEPALMRIAAEARDKQLRAEHLLMALKDVWYSLPSVARADTPEDQNAILQRIVTLCVRSYYVS